MTRIVTLTTDFGTRDYYAAGVKGAILRECPDAVIVDVTHDLEPFDLREASFTLWQAAPCFPEGTVHAAVVFPETGVEDVVAVRAGGHSLVGPDNGVLSMAAVSLGIEEIRLVKDISRPSSCKTFDGRFLVAPAAGRLASGGSMSALGPEVEGIRELEIPRATVSPELTRGEILHVDRFGNLVTSLRAEDLPAGWGKRLSLRAMGREWKVRLAACFAEGDPGEMLLVKGSVGLIEISCNRASAAAASGLGVGDGITIAKAGRGRGGGSSERFGR
ncbi:MAG: SAM-dependent chlorinase/fluorinase [Candidatus Korarchaeota archaeon]|nr:SAM-dependent chlorinase/fluorinase [Candidatus Korarchaeota archaeon]